mmetsp:Transcript_23981/g.51766  ORF Transcript_23981/g.51766 Transcript_23981/m.51766 type:complete len:103 (-) Transcript_23981:37-345(-)
MVVSSCDRNRMNHSVETRPVQMKRTIPSTKTPAVIFAAGMEAEGAEAGIMAEAMAGAVEAGMDPIVVDGAIVDTILDAIVDTIVGGVLIPDTCLPVILALPS